MEKIAKSIGPDPSSVDLLEEAFGTLRFIADMQDRLLTVLCRSLTHLSSIDAQCKENGELLKKSMLEKKGFSLASEVEKHRANAAGKILLRTYMMRGRGDSEMKKPKLPLKPSERIKKVIKMMDECLMRNEIPSLTSVKRALRDQRERAIFMQAIAACIICFTDKPWREEISAFLDQETGYD